MKLENYRLLKEPDKSFIVHHEIKSFSFWHHHPEYELVLILKGKGKRMVGDNIDRFKPNDLVLVGSYLPHAWLCDREYTDHTSGFLGEAIVYQFLYDFLGPQFFSIPENRELKQLLGESSRGLKFTGNTKEKIISLMVNSYNLDGPDRLFSLFAIFKILSKTKEYSTLSGPGFMEPYHKVGNEAIQKAIDYIFLNFHRTVTMKDMLNITNMSNTAFCIAFKRINRMTFKEYLLNTRVGYACKLITDSSLNISQIANNCGFENISNFNLRFKKLKGITPSLFRKQAESLKKYPSEAR